MLTAFPEAAKEKMFSPWCADPAPAARTVNPEKVHQGVSGKNRALFLGQSVSNCASALGFEFLTIGNRVRSRCTGKERDNESGLDQMGARYYSSGLGRFTSADPLVMEMHRLQDPQMLNLYHYARNNPLSYTDETGLDVNLDCSKVSGEQCGQTVTDLNNRKDAQFQVTRDDKTGLLQAHVDDPSTLSKSEGELYKAINDPNNHATLELRAFSPNIMGDQYAGKGLNILDRADLTQFGKANSQLPGEIIAHAAVEAYAGVGEGKTNYLDAHNFASEFFGKLHYTDPVGLPRGAAKSTSGVSTYSFERLGTSVNVQKIFITPQPRASVPKNWERIPGNLVVSTTDKKK